MKEKGNRPNAARLPPPDPLPPTSQHGAASSPHAFLSLIQAHIFPYLLASAGHLLWAICYQMEPCNGWDKAEGKQEQGEDSSLLFWRVAAYSFPADILICQISQASVSQRKKRRDFYGRSEPSDKTGELRNEETDTSVLLGTDGFFPLLYCGRLLSYRWKTKCFRQHPLQGWNRYLKLCKPPENRQNALCCHAAL